VDVDDILIDFLGRKGEKGEDAERQHFYFYYQRAGPAS